MLVCYAPLASPAQQAGKLIDEALVSAHRSDANKARDKYRHPKETLLFFGLRPGMTVVEISPGAGWYTEILAPVLKDSGSYIAAGVAVEDPSTERWQRQSRDEFIERFTKQPAVFGKVSLTSFKAPRYVEIAPKGSADLVLT